MTMWDLFQAYKTGSTVEIQSLKPIMRKLMWVHLMPRKHVTKPSTPFVIETLSKLGSEGNFFSFIKGICRKLQLTSYLMVTNGPLSPNDQKWFRNIPSSHSDHTENPSEWSRARKGSKTKCTYWTGRNKLSLFTIVGTSCIEKSKESTTTKPPLVTNKQLQQDHRIES